MSKKMVTIPAKLERTVPIYFCDSCGKRIGQTYHSCASCDGHFHSRCLINDVYLYSTQHYSAAVCAGSGYYDKPHYGELCDKCYKKRKQKLKD